MYSYKKVRTCIDVRTRIKWYQTRDLVNTTWRGKSMANYTKTNTGNEGRIELHDILKLTGAEVSINRLPAGVGVPFIHSHKNNEEIYGVLEGMGKAVIDGEAVELTAGDWLKITPAAKRQFSAAADTGVTYVCIQVKENSLEGFTADDAIIG